MALQIMFVDDEPNVLSGLRRTLHSQRRDWEMEFANGGEDALARLENKQYDVIISDMRMPRIDGAMLLAKVAEIQPRAIRLVLSGQSDHEKIFRAIGPAHQFLSKPCDPEVLIKTVRQALALRDRLTDQKLAQVVSKIDKLPSIPYVYEELVRLLEREETSLETVGSVIGRDLAMTAKILKLVNSSFFGLPTHVSDPTRAVALLGLNIVRPLVLSANVFAYYEERDLGGFTLEELVDHSIAVATSARKIALRETRNEQVADDAFLGGMLHDIGKLILAAEMPQAVAETHQRAVQCKETLWQAEKQVIGTTHAELGAYLLALWGLPNSIVETVAFHHEPIASGQHDFTALTAVYSANVIRHQLAPDDRIAIPDLEDAYLNDLSIADHVLSWREVCQLAV